MPTSMTLIKIIAAWETKLRGGNAVLCVCSYVIETQCTAPLHLIIRHETTPAPPDGSPATDIWWPSLENF